MDERAVGNCQRLAEATIRWRAQDSRKGHQGRRRMSMELMPVIPLMLRDTLANRSL